MMLVTWVTFLTLSTFTILLCEQVFPVIWRLVQRRSLKKGVIALQLRSQPRALFNQKLLYDFYEHKDVVISSDNRIARHKEGVLLYELGGASLKLSPCYWPLVDSFSITISQRLSLQNYAICFQELIELKSLLNGQWELLHDDPHTPQLELSVAALSVLQEPGAMPMSF